MFKFPPVLLNKEGINVIEHKGMALWILMAVLELLG